MYLIRKINATTAKAWGTISSIRNPVKLIFSDIESKSKIDINTIINAEYIRTKVPIIFNPIANIFRDIRFLILMEVYDILSVTLYSKDSIIFSDGPPIVLNIFRYCPLIQCLTYFPHIVWGSGLNHKIRGY